MFHTFEFVLGMIVCFILMNIEFYYDDEEDDDEIPKQENKNNKKNS